VVPFVLSNTRQSFQASLFMKRPKRDPLSVLEAMRKKAWAHRPDPLVAIPFDELAAFQGLRQIIEQTRLCIAARSPNVLGMPNVA